MKREKGRRRDHKHVDIFYPKRPGVDGYPSTPLISAGINSRGTLNEP
jgi:hypothetical protein